MVSKCANPDCSTSFRYFHQGKLFRIETAIGTERRRALGIGLEDKNLLKRLEFYWLCDSCAERFTLIFDRASGITVCPRDRSRAAAS